MSIRLYRHLILLILTAALAISAEDAVETSADLSAYQDTTVSTPDTVPKPTTGLQPPQPIRGAHMAFDIGLSIGGVPIFDMWRSALPGSLSDLGLAADFGAELDAEPSDNQLLKFENTQRLDQFNFVIPLGMSIHRIRDDRSYSFALSFIQSRRQFQAEITVDGDRNRRIDLFESMAYSSLSVEAAYQWAIPQMFFSIDGAQQTFLTVGAGMSPLNFFERRNEIASKSPEDDARMTAVADSIRSKFSKLSANGLALTWRVGINTLKNNRRGGGREMGLFYYGSYNAGFYRDGTQITQNQIDGKETDSPLSFMSSRVEFKFTFLRSITNRHNENAGENINEMVDNEVVKEDISENTSEDAAHE